MTIIINLFMYFVLKLYNKVETLYVSIYIFFFANKKNEFCYKFLI